MLLSCGEISVSLKVFNYRTSLKQHGGLPYPYLANLLVSPSELTANEQHVTAWLSGGANLGGRTSSVPVPSHTN